MDGSPTSFGSSRASVFPHQGPASYVQLIEGVAPALATGGDTVDAESEGGFRWFDFLTGGLTDSGVYFVVAVPTTVSGVIASPTRLAQPSLTYRLKWYDASTMAEVAAETDLDAEIVRLFAIGPK
jgi:hypothetical protein